MYTIELYRIDVSGETFTRVASIDDFEGLQYVERKNNIGRAVFRLNVFSQWARRSNLIPNRSHVVVKKNNTVVWAGPVTSVSCGINDVGGTVLVEAQGMLHHMNNRYTDAITTYIAEDAGDLAWDLIDTVQDRANGWAGFSEGSITATEDRDRTYEYKRIADAVIDLTNVIDGFDFDLTYNQDADNMFTGVNFNVYDRLGADRIDLPDFELGDNVNSVTMMHDREILNTFTYLGSGTGENILTSTDSDANSQVGYTRLEKVVARKDISLQETLDNHVEKDIQEYAGENFKVLVEMTPDRKPVYGAVNLGDRVNLKLTTVEDSYLNFERTGFVEEVSVAVDNNGVEFITYTIYVAG